MATVSIEDAQVRLKDLIAELRPGGEVVITQDDRPVARLTAEVLRDKPPRRLALQRGFVVE